MVKEGEVKDLVEKLKKGEITKKEVLEEMKKRGLYHHAGEPIPGIFAIGAMIVWGALCFFPVICKLLNLNIAEIPSMQMPLEITYIVFLFAVAVTPPLFYSVYLREKMSETGDENIILVKVGAYRIVRHPAALAGLIWLLALPVIFNRFALNLPFTILSVFGEIALVTGFFLQTWHEEKINTKKWGDEYRQYMKEVPRFNFVKGLWNLRK